jgi:hypothetical protein
MLDILNRKQFKEVWEKILPGITKEGNPLWASEDHTGRKSRWFIRIYPIDHNTWNKTNFHLWCAKNCRGQILCYSTSEENEWWGFTHKADIVWWVMKWA